MKEKAPARRAPVRRRRRVASRTAAPAPRKRQTLRERREEERGRAMLLAVAGIFLVAGVVIYILWRPEIRIREITTPGLANESAIIKAASDELEGAYWHVFPRDSFFFYPERAIRARILEANPGLKSVKIARDGFHSLVITADARVSAFWWCGTPEVPLVNSSCFDADHDGFIYAAVDPSASSSEKLFVRAFVDTASSTDGSVIRGKVQGSGYVPDILDFIQTIEVLGVPVDSVAIRGDEADLFSGSTRISYVIGGEKHAIRDARAALPQLNLANGSVEYVDLRFPGKVYIRRTGEAAAE